MNWMKLAVGASEVERGNQLPTNCQTCISEIRAQNLHICCCNFFADPLEDLKALNKICVTTYSGVIVF
jgi:hypothetical protein